MPGVLGRPSRCERSPVLGLLFLHEIGSYHLSKAWRTEVGGGLGTKGRASKGQEDIGMLLQADSFS